VGDGAVTGTPGDEAGQLCDPDTGLCAVLVASGVDQTSNQPASEQQVGEVSPVTLPQLAGPGSVILMVLVVLFTLGLVLAPAAAWRHFSKTNRPGEMSA
jgi:hypothetical protein